MQYTMVNNILLYIWFFFYKRKHGLRCRINLKNAATYRLKSKYPVVLELLCKRRAHDKECFYPIQLSIDVGLGWFPIIEKITKEISDLGNDEIKAVQIKEKFGELRYYTNYTTDEVESIIEFGELRAAVTCEVCGRSGSLRGEHWYQTLCDRCDK